MYTSNLFRRLRNAKCVNHFLKLNNIYKFNKYFILHSNDLAKIEFVTDKLNLSFNSKLSKPVLIILEYYWNINNLRGFFFLQHHIIDPVHKALDYYTEMEKALEKEKLNRTGSLLNEKIVKSPDKQKGSQRNAEPTVNSISNKPRAFQPSHKVEKK